MVEALLVQGAGQVRAQRGRRDEGQAVGAPRDREEGRAAGRAQRRDVGVVAERKSPQARQGHRVPVVEGGQVFAPVEV